MKWFSRIAILKTETYRWLTAADRFEKTGFVRVSGNFGLLTASPPKRVCVRVLFGETMRFSARDDLLSDDSHEFHFKNKGCVRRNRARNTFASVGKFGWTNQF